MIYFSPGFILMRTSKFFLEVLPLFLVLFIDSMGLGLLFPILNVVIMSPDAHFLPASASENVRMFWYGMTLSIFMLCWFFGATILGDLSDSVGRKKALLICLLGAGLGYFFSGLAIAWHSLSLLIFGRVIAGFTAGSQPIAQAAIVDLSTEETKARNIGYVIFAIALGFVFGPVLGGLLSNAALVSWFTLTTPMYFASLLSLVNVVLLWVLFFETHPAKKRVKIKLHRSIHLFISAFQHKKVRRLSWVLLTMILGWSSYISFIPLYMYRVYRFDTFETSMFLAVLGLGFSVACGYLVGYFSKRFHLRKVTYWSFILSALCVLITLCFAIQWVNWVVVFFIGITVGIGYSDLITLFSNQVSADEQGWVMGITGSIMALCFGLVDLLVGFFARYGVVVPLVCAVVGFVLAALLLMNAATSGESDGGWQSPAVTEE